MFVKIDRVDGFSHESNDCTVRALASACGISYADAHQIAQGMGRKSGEGFKMEQLLQSPWLSNFDIRKLCFPTKRAMILDVMKLKGNFIVRIIYKNNNLSHVFAVVDGVIYDNQPPKSKLLYIHSFWKIERKPEIEADTINEIS